MCVASWSVFFWKRTTAKWEKIYSSHEIVPAESYVMLCNVHFVDAEEELPHKNKLKINVHGKMKQCGQVFAPCIFRREPIHKTRFGTEEEWLSDMLLSGIFGKLLDSFSSKPDSWDTKENLLAIDLSALRSTTAGICLRISWIHQFELPCQIIFWMEVINKKRNYSFKNISQFYVHLFILRHFSFSEFSLLSSPCYGLPCSFLYFRRSPSHSSAACLTHCHLNSFRFFTTSNTSIVLNN